MAARRRQTKAEREAERRRAMLFEAGEFGRVLLNSGDPLSTLPERLALSHERREAVERLGELEDLGSAVLLACSPYGSAALRSAVSRSLTKTFGENWVCCPKCGSPTGPETEYLCEVGDECGDGILCPYCAVEATFGLLEDEGERCPHSFGVSHESASWFPLSGDRTKLIAALDRLVVPEPLNAPEELDVEALKEHFGSTFIFLEDYIDGDMELSSVVDQCRDLVAHDGYSEEENSFARFMYRCLPEEMSARMEVYEWAPSGASVATGLGWFSFYPTEEERDGAERAAVEILRQFVSLLESYVKA